MGEQVAARIKKEKSRCKTAANVREIEIDTGKGEQQLTNADPISRAVLLR